MAPSAIPEDSKSGGFVQLPERFLQVLWNEQRLGCDLRLVCGSTLRVVSPGTWNSGAGPDFRGAVLVIAGVRRRGDVEVHRRVVDWRRHGHDGDPGYASVILHVVADAAAPAGWTGPPCFCLADHLDTSLARLLAELELACYPDARRVPPGECAVRWAMNDDAAVIQLLDRAGLARLEGRAVTLQREALASGWDQAVYVRTFEALGYRSNRVPFHRLAASTSLARLREGGGDARLALLFGRAGLLPDPSVSPVAPGLRASIPALWDLWWSSGVDRLPLDWDRGGCRPQNTPERRLAGGCEFLERTDCRPFQWMLRWVTTVPDPARLPGAVVRAFATATPWDRLSTFRSCLPLPVRLLGVARVRDIVVNVLLPALLGYARQTGDESLSAYAVAAYRSVPRLQANRLQADAVHRFLVPPSRGGVLLRRACAQQGLLELYRSLCLALRTDCGNCPMGSEHRVADRTDVEYSD